VRINRSQKHRQNNLYSFSKTPSFRCPEKYCRRERKSVNVCVGERVKANLRVRNSKRKSRTEAQYSENAALVSDRKLFFLTPRMLRTSSDYEFLLIFSFNSYEASRLQRTVLKLDTLSEAQKTLETEHFFQHHLSNVQGGSNMTGTNCDLFTHKSSRSYLNHLVTKSRTREVLDNREMARIFEH
jgi:hypothetical protein